MKKLLIIIMLLSTTTLFARPFSDKGFKYYKTLQAIDENDDNHIGRFELDEEVMKHSGYKDKRLVMGKTLIPFFVREIRQVKAATGYMVPQVIFQSDEEKSRVYVLKFPEPPAETEYRELIIAADGVYETKVSISLGKTPDHWQAEQNYSLFDYGDTKTGGDKKVEFYPGEYRYARLRFKNQHDFRFTQVIYTPITKLAELEQKIDSQKITTSEDSDNRSTSYYFDNPLHKPIHRLELEFQNSTYDRKIRFYELNSNKNYRHILSGTVYKEQQTRGLQNFTFKRTIKNALKFTIKNGDDQPLILQAMRVYTPRQEILFRLPSRARMQAMKDKTLKLYYANPYALTPEFDFRYTYKKTTKFQSYQLTKQQENANFGYTIMEPPVSSWIIRILFIVGSVLVSFASFRIFLTYTARPREQE